MAKSNIVGMNCPECKEYVDLTNTTNETVKRTCSCGWCDVDVDPEFTEEQERLDEERLANLEKQYVEELEGKMSEEYDRQKAIEKIGQYDEVERSQLGDIFCSECGLLVKRVFDMESEDIRHYGCLCGLHEGKLYVKAD